MANYVFTMCYIYTVCIHGKKVLCCMPDRKHTENYRAHGKEPDSGSVSLETNKLVFYCPVHLIRTRQVSRAVGLQHSIIGKHLTQLLLLPSVSTNKQQMWHLFRHT